MPALSPSPPSSTVGQAILTSRPIQAGADGYPPHGPTVTAISDFNTINTSSTTSYAHTPYLNTIRPTTPVSMGSSLWLYPNGGVSSSVPTEYKVFPTGIDFEDGATRHGGFGLGCSVAVMFAGTVLARYAF